MGDVPVSQVRQLPHQRLLRRIDQGLAAEVNAQKACAEVAASYREWVDLFEKAKAGHRAAKAALPED